MITVRPSVLAGHVNECFHSGQHPGIVSVVVPYLRFQFDDSESNAWALLSIVGQGFREFADLRAQLMPIFRALVRLHTLGVVHGDARLPNIVYCAAQGWMWIDMDVPFVVSSTRFFADWYCLLNDIQRVKIPSVPLIDFSSIAESALSALYVFDDLGTFVTINEAACDSFLARLTALLEAATIVD